MPSKTNPLTEAQLSAYESQRGLGDDLLEAVKQMKAGKTCVVAPSPSRKRDARPSLDAPVNPRTSGETSMEPTSVATIKSN